MVWCQSQRLTYPCAGVIVEEIRTQFFHLSSHFVKMKSEAYGKLPDSLALNSISVASTALINRNTLENLGKVHYGNNDVTVSSVFRSKMSLIMHCRFKDEDRKMSSLAKCSLAYHPQLYIVTQQSFSTPKFLEQKSQTHVLWVKCGPQDGQLWLADLW